jgi:hypothetical protein
MAPGQENWLKGIALQSKYKNGGFISRGFSDSNFKQRPFGDIGFADNPENRCPVVLLLETSGSMSGAPIQQLNEGLQVFRDELFADPLAAKRVEVAIVTFGPVNVATEFTTVQNFLHRLFQRRVIRRWGRL